MLVMFYVEENKAVMEVPDDITEEDLDQMAQDWANTNVAVLYDEIEEVEW